MRLAMAFAPGEDIAEGCKSRSLVVGQVAGALMSMI
jgi:hypothetical protein